MNVLLDAMPLSNIELPEELQPKIPAFNESYSVAQFYLLNDNITGVLALGSFSAQNFTAFGLSLLTGLQKLKASGAKQLIVDVVCHLLCYTDHYTDLFITLSLKTNNGGGNVMLSCYIEALY